MSGSSALDCDCRSDLNRSAGHALRAPEFSERRLKGLRSFFLLLADSLLTLRKASAYNGAFFGA
jgi:hypothetical protein